MSVAENNPSTGTSGIRERRIILLLCLLAAVHVFIFSATFPFFNIVDEQLHFDNVVRYSHGDLPRGFDTPCDEALQYIAIYHTPEYIWPPSHFAGNQIAPPPWTLPIDEVAPIILAKEALWREKVKNTEGSSPPLYYTVAGGWWRLGKLLGFDGGHLLYWIRFLNIPVIIALVWLGYFAGRKIFPENFFMRLAVPSLIAFMPQTAFYAIQNDVLSPVFFGIAFILLVKFFEMEVPTVRLGAAAGLALAATFLTKISNLPLLAASGAFLALKIFQLGREKKLRAAGPSLGALFFCAVPPAALWIARIKTNFGDLTGTAGKIGILGWTRQPFAQWFHHPIFTPHGFWIFISGNLSTFWQGELSWDGRPLALPVVDLVYCILSLSLLALVLVALIRHRTRFSAMQLAAMWFGFVCLASAFAFFALLSVQYDFQDCFYPSRAHPYFTSGRLMLGVLIPFLLLFVYGLDRAVDRFGNTAKFFVLALLILFMLASEITIDRQIFPNPYNWFHM